LKEIKKNKFLFFSTHFFDIKKSNFLTQRKIYTDYKYAHKLLNLNIYNKKLFSLLLFKFIKIDNKLSILNILKKNLNIIKDFIKLKFFFNFKNYFSLKW